MSIPGIYPPVAIGPHLVVDGGVLNPVPTSVVTEMGADVVIGVKLASNEQMHAPGPQSLLSILMRSIDLMQGKIVHESAARATILIEPEVNNFSGFALRHFSAGRRFIESGEAAAEAALPRLGVALPWLRPLPPSAVPSLWTENVLEAGARLWHSDHLIATGSSVGEEQGVGQGNGDQAKAFVAKLKTFRTSLTKPEQELLDTILAQAQGVEVTGYTTETTWDTLTTWLTTTTTATTTTTTTTT
jgi:hypothetical protein